MPRLDNSDEEVIEVYNLAFDNPGSTRPMDLCRVCYDASWEGLGFDIDHPDYRDAVCRCIECGCRLIGADN